MRLFQWNNSLGQQWYCPNTEHLKKTFTNHACFGCTIVPWHLRSHTKNIHSCTRMFMNVHSHQHLTHERGSLHSCIWNTYCTHWDMLVKIYSFLFQIIVRACSARLQLCFCKINCHSSTPVPLVMLFMLSGLHM